MVQKHHTIYITKVYPMVQKHHTIYITKSIPYGKKTPHYIYNEKYTLW